jgi:UDP-N-acetylmuramoylalanine--D-glutamate ligase
MHTNLAHLSIAVIGYGITGRACVRFLLSQQAKVCVLDRNVNIQEIITQDTELKSSFSEQLSATVFDANISLSAFTIVVISPGVDPHQACFNNYREQGGILIGDIELFAWFNKTPLIGITGSNGKTTVTDMLGKVLTSAGLNVELAGNYGKGALDLLLEEPTRKEPLDFVILELSSYQLEMTKSLKLEFATVLNITEDHLDRHGSFVAYKQAKQGIFAMAKHIIACRDEAFSYPENTDSNKAGYRQNSAKPFVCAEVGLTPNDSIYSLSKDSGAQLSIQFKGSPVLLLSELHLKGAHNYVNSMIVLAICDQLLLDRSLTVPAICEYKGLPHRFETVKLSTLDVDGKITNITWINDSKATNLGACQAALSCFESDNDYLILIAGGDAKGVDLSPLKASIETQVDQLIVLGKDAPSFIQLIPDAIQVKNLSEAVAKSLSILKDNYHPHASVLLSPACASLDMFANYQERGNVFTAAIKEQVA